MIYNNLKKFIKKFPILWKLLTWSKDCLIKLSRLKDVFMMMLLVHLWPKQTYRFSVRKLLPNKKNRFSIKSKPVIPFDLLKSKCSNIPIMKEINVVGIGSSFDLNNLKDLKGPIFLLGFWSPLRIDSDGKIFYKHLFDYNKAKFTYHNLKNIGELFNDQTNVEYKTNNLTYIVYDQEVVENFKKNGNNIICLKMYGTDENGDEYLVSNDEYLKSKDEATSSYVNLIDHDQVKVMTAMEKVYKFHNKRHLQFAPTKSFLPGLCILSFFAEKINVYGWDFYLRSSPENMSYWKLFFNMYKYKFDAIQFKARDHFESALINFYYGYQLSMLPNIKIHGYMGKLSKHHRLIKRIERVLFN